MKTFLNFLTKPLQNNFKEAQFLIKMQDRGTLFPVWERLRIDQTIRKIVKGYKILLLMIPVQKKVLLNTPLRGNQTFLGEENN